MSLPAPPPAASLPPTLAPLATPPAHHVAQTAFSTLLLTLPLPLLASSRVASARRYEKERLMAEEGLVPDEFRNGSPAIGSTAAGAAKDEDEERAAVNLQLESLGFRVGGDLAERLAFSKPRFTDSLDIVKFVCKDVWTAAFNKQIDNLRTNHRGVFVLQDAVFPPIAHISTSQGGPTDVQLASLHLAFPRGLIRGALARLGLPCTVTADSAGLPQVTFQIKSSKVGP